MNDATEEIARTTGKVIDAGRELGAFLSKFISGPAEQISGIFEDRLRFKRLLNLLAFEKKIQLLTAGRKTPDRPLPLKLAYLLIDHVALEDDEAIQTQWAKLLINITDTDSGVNQQLAFIEILKNLSPIEARILNTVYALNFEDTLHNRIKTEKLPDFAETLPEKGADELELKTPCSEVIFALANLDRLNCISIARSLGGGQLFSSLNPTLFGKLFVEACTLK